MLRISRDLPKAFNFVNGKRCAPSASNGKFDIIEPAKGAVLASCQASSTDDVAEAVAAAKAAFPIWSKQSPLSRSRVLSKVATNIREIIEDLAYWEARDNGKPVYETRMDILGVADNFEYYAGLMASVPHGEFYDYRADLNRKMYTQREPLGVCAGIGAWNYPFQTSSWKIAPALACGNTFVYKPSPFAPMTPVYMAEIITNAGAPPGVINIVQGKGETGQALCLNNNVAKLSFTGSVATGSKIQAAASAGGRVKPVTLELGGKSPLIICEDAPIDSAVSSAMMANWFTQGEVCSNGTRVFVHKNIKDQFMEKLIERTKVLPIGDPLKEETRIGATINEAHMKKVLGYIELAKKEGCKIEYGGERVIVPGYENGYFLSPCILNNCRDDMRVCTEEIFGCVMSVLDFDDYDDVIRRANNSDYGLAAGVYTNDLSRAHKFASELQAGSVYVNTYNDVHPTMPFGGFRQSGYGRELGMASLNNYTQMKAVYINTGDGLDAPF